MLTDIVTIIRKEWKESFQSRGNVRGGLVNLLIMVGVFGIVIPLQTGAEWFQVQILPIVWAWIPVFMTTWMVADAIAGERERHTLETLLASRLSDRAILAGKVAASVLYGFTIEVVNLLLAALTVNIAHPELGIQFYEPGFFFSLLGFSLLSCILLSALGVLVSLRSSTARQAYQRISIALMVVWVLPTIVLQFLPDSFKSSLNVTLTGINYGHLIGVASGVMFVLDALLLFIASKRFRRSDLVLA
jgi:ABC-2 type transport system permease protein